MKILGLDQLINSENAIDCYNCPVSTDLKCCTYQPLWLCFSIGEALEESHTEEKIKKVLKDFVSSPVGLSATVKKRQLFANKGTWGFAKDPDLLCSFFSNGGCSIWSTRPSVCQFYFCKSQYGLKGLEYYRDIENWLLKVEGEMLYLWLLEKGYSHADWEVLSDYMDESEVKNNYGLQLSDHLVFKDWSQARQFYIESYFWLKEKTKEEILQLCGPEILESYKTLVVRRQQLC